MRKLSTMRLLIVTESFLPNVNGVTNSVRRILEHLHAANEAATAAGKPQPYEALVVAPGARDFQTEDPTYAGFPVERVPTVMMPHINSLPIGVPTATLRKAIRDFRPDVIHLASPFALAGRAVFLARAHGIPTVAVYQTDVAGFAQRYRLTWLVDAAWAWTKAMHNAACRTLAPSSLAEEALAAHGIDRIYRWGRGVDTTLFHPSRRRAHVRAKWDPTGRATIVGYVGRLAAEKGVHRLAALAGREDIQLVIIGDGPERAHLEKVLPGAVFTGALSGEQLAEAYASLDIFVHPGEFETFCQTIQEAHASGIPTIGPRAGGPVDLIRPGVDGYLLGVDTFEEELPRAVDDILADYPTMVAHSLAAVEDRSWDALCEELLRHYAAVQTPAKQPV